MRRQIELVNGETIGLIVPKSLVGKVATKDSDGLKTMCRFQYT